MHEGDDLPAKEDVATAFGAALRQNRKGRGFTQERLAEAAGLTPTFVSMMERGQYQPSLHTAFLVAAGLGVNVADLIADAHEALRSRSVKD